MLKEQVNVHLTIVRWIRDTRIETAAKDQYK